MLDDTELKDNICDVTNMDVEILMHIQIFVPMHLPF